MERPSTSSGPFDALFPGDSWFVVPAGGHEQADGASNGTYWFSLQKETGHCQALRVSRLLYTGQQ